LSTIHDSGVYRCQVKGFEEITQEFEVSVTERCESNCSTLNNLSQSSATNLPLLSSNLTLYDNNFDDGGNVLVIENEKTIKYGDGYNFDAEIFNKSDIKSIAQVVVAVSNNTSISNVYNLTDSQSNYTFFICKY
jgi:hypothetical protein